MLIRRLLGIVLDSASTAHHRRLKRGLLKVPCSFSPPFEFGVADLAPAAWQESQDQQEAVRTLVEMTREHLVEPEREDLLDIEEKVARR